MYMVWPLYDILVCWNTTTTRPARMELRASRLLTLRCSRRILQMVCSLDTHPGRGPGGRGETLWKCTRLLRADQPICGGKRPLPAAAVARRVATGISDPHRSESATAIGYFLSMYLSAIGCGIPSSQVNFIGQGTENLTRDT